VLDISTIEAKGLKKLLAMPGTVPGKLRMHISEVEAGSRTHPLHTHSGVEAFYVFEGNVTVEVEGEHFPLAANEAMVVEAARPHCIFNSGSTRTRYLVIIAP
jgi:mannose-6-phosphate isomerase-like protein (cupin superfamily)